MNLGNPLLINAILVAVIYSVSAMGYWRKIKVPVAEQSFKANRLMVLLGLVLHGNLLYQTILNSGQGLNLGFFNSLSVIFWLTVLIYWIADLINELTSLQAFVLPPAALVVLFALFFSSNHYLPMSATPAFLAHISIALLAYGLFTFATLHAALMAVAERKMHHRKTLIPLPNFPPLLVMEDILFKTIGLGFILLTITLVSGMLFSEVLFGRAMQFNHKTIFSIASWLIYGTLLFGHYRYGWRGLKAIRWALAGFLLLLLAYVGSKFILEIVLHRV